MGRILLQIKVVLNERWALCLYKTHDHTPQTQWSRMIFIALSFSHIEADHSVYSIILG